MPVSLDKSLIFFENSRFTRRTRRLSRTSSRNARS